MKDILAKYDSGMPQVGETIEGEAISISKAFILINLGFLGTGIVYPGEFYDQTHLRQSLAVGQKVAAVLLDLENENGYRELSLRQAQRTSAWEDIREKKENGMIVTTSIININKGGLIVEINGIQGFLPLSQLSAEHYPKVEGGDTTKIIQVLQKFRGQEFPVKIIDFSEAENKLIVSERAIINEQLLAELEKIQEGAVISGPVTSLTKFGAFVKISENLEGLIHVSEIDWRMVKDPRDYLQIGQEVEAKVVNIDKKEGRVFLSLKALKPDPWTEIDKQFSVGQSQTGTIVKVSHYGLLVKLTEEFVGLVPYPEVANRKDWQPQIGEEIQVAIVNIEPAGHKMLLTLQGS